MHYRQIWEQANGPIPTDEQGRTYEIHHIDGNRENDDISNLRCVSIQEHYEIHKRQGDTLATWVIAQRLKLSQEERDEIMKKRAPIMSQIHKGKTVSAATRAKISEIRTGKPRSADTKAKISIARSGQPKSETTKAKISQARKNKKLGPRSAETKAKISQANKGKPCSAETKAKISQAKRGSTLSAEAITKRTATRKANKEKKKLLDQK